MEEETIFKVFPPCYFEACTLTTELPPQWALLCPVTRIVLPQITLPWAWFMCRDSTLAFVLLVHTTYCCFALLFCQLHFLSGQFHPSLRANKRLYNRKLIFSFPKFATLPPDLSSERLSLCTQRVLTGFAPSKTERAFRITCVTIWPCASVFWCRRLTGGVFFKRSTENGTLRGGGLIAPTKCDDNLGNTPPRESAPFLLDGELVK